MYAIRTFLNEKDANAWVKDAVEASIQVTRRQADAGSKQVIDFIIITVLAKFQGEPPSDPPQVQ
jgi:hypothetical protein